MRNFLWSTAAAALLATAAWAQDEDMQWAVLDLGGGFSIEVPAVLADRALPGKTAPKDVMMSFGVDAGAPGTLSCQLTRSAYPADLPREILAASLAKGDTGDFCTVARPGTSGQQKGEPIAGQTDGVPSATCLSAYTDESQEIQGRVLTMAVVAAKKNFYRLTCVSAYDDQDGATVAYASRWSPIISRMQKSFKLAADEK